MSSAGLAGALVFAHSCLAIAQVASLQIRITEGDGATYAPRSRSGQPLTAQVTDEAGRAVAGAAVSFRLPDQGPGGLFANGMRTDIAITDANGRAGVRHIQLNDVSGEFQIRITAAKDQARAGTLVRQFIAGPAAASGRPVVSKPKSKKKWIVLSVLAAGVAGGLGAGIAAHPSAHPPAPAPVPPPVTIGPPVVSLGSR
jgi:hypothetical protein